MGEVYQAFSIHPFAVSRVHQQEAETIFILRLRSWGIDFLYFVRLFIGFELVLVFAMKFFDALLFFLDPTFNFRHPIYG